MESIRTAVQKISDPKPTIEAFEFEKKPPKGVKFRDRLGKLVVSFPDGQSTNESICKVVAAVRDDAGYTVAKSSRDGLSCL